MGASAGHQRRLPDHPHDQRHADLPAAELRRARAACRSRSTSTTSTPTRPRRSWGRRREERIAEFLEENDCPVLALYEGSWLRVSGSTAVVTGRSRLFRRSRGRRVRRWRRRVRPARSDARVRRRPPPTWRLDVVLGYDWILHSLSGDLFGSCRRPTAPLVASSEPNSRSAQCPPSSTSFRVRHATPTAVVYCEANFGELDGKTANGLVRHSERYEILLGDRQHQGRASTPGSVLGDKPNGIPVCAEPRRRGRRRGRGAVPDYFIFGMAPSSGMLSAGRAPRRARRHRHAA